MRFPPVRVWQSGRFRCHPGVPLQSLWHGLTPDLLNLDSVPIELDGLSRPAQPFFIALVGAPGKNTVWNDGLEFKRRSAPTAGIQDLVLFQRKGAELFIVFRDTRLPQWQSLPEERDIENFLSLLFEACWGLFFSIHHKDPMDISCNYRVRSTRQIS